MSQENVEIVRRAIEYFLRTDENLWETIDSEVEIHDHDLPDAGGVRRSPPGQWEAGGVPKAATRDFRPPSPTSQSLLGRCLH